MTIDEAKQLEVKIANNISCLIKKFFGDRGIQSQDFIGTICKKGSYVL